MPKALTNTTTGTTIGTAGAARRRNRRRARNASTGRGIQQYSTPRANAMWGGDPHTFSENLYGLLKSQGLIAAGKSHDAVVGLINFSAFGAVNL